MPLVNLPSETFEHHHEEFQNYSSKRLPKIIRFIFNLVIVWLLWQFNNNLLVDAMSKQNFRPRRNQPQFDQETSPQQARNSQKITKKTKEQKTATLSPLIMARLSFDNDPTLDVATATKRITSMIDETIKIFPYRKNAFTRVLQQNDFTILAATTEKLRNEQKIPTDYIGNCGFFSPSSKTLYFQFDNDATLDNMGLINHEFMHADNFFLHNSIDCKEENVHYAITPVFPYNSANAKQYHDAFDLGDNRIKEFARLTTADVLDKDETVLLNKYIAAAKTCPFLPNKLPLTYDQYKDLHGWQKDKNELHFNSDDGDKYKALAITHNEQTGQTYALVKPTDPIKTLLRLPEFLARTRKKYAANPNIELAERETYTFQRLSELAINIFYPEAYALQQEHVARCTQSASIPKAKI